MESMTGESKRPSQSVEVTLPLDLLEDLERFMGERAWTLRQRPTSEREWYAVPVATECAPNACQQKTCDLFASYRGPCGGCCRCLGFCLNVAHIVHQAALEKGSGGCPCGSGVAETDCHPGTKWADVMGIGHVETCGATYGGECDRCPTDKGSSLDGQP